MKKCKVTAPFPVTDRTGQCGLELQSYSKLLNNFIHCEALGKVDLKTFSEHFRTCSGLSGSTSESSAVLRKRLSVAH